MIFAGFAIFLWYRLVKDAWERENEELEDASGGRSASGAVAERGYTRRMPLAAQTVATSRASEAR